MARHFCLGYIVMSWAKICGFITCLSVSQYLVMFPAHANETISETGVTGVALQGSLILEPVPASYGELIVRLWLLDGMTVKRLLEQKVEPGAGAQWPFDFSVTEPMLREQQYRLMLEVLQNTSQGQRLLHEQYPITTQHLSEPIAIRVKLPPTPRQ